MKPKIGLTLFSDQDNEKLCIRKTYIDAVIKAGALPIVLPFTDEYVILDEISENIDGIIFTGGHDINPIYYEKGNDNNCLADEKVIIQGNKDIRDKEELYLLKKVIEMNKPVLGICRGCQLINVFNGGTLYGDIKTMLKTDINHEQDKPYDRGTHEVVIEKDSFLYERIKIENLLVNSIHHQGIKELGNNLKITAYAQDGLIEGIEMTNRKFVVGVQWHPEWLLNFDEIQMNIFNMFVEKC